MAPKDRKGKYIDRTTDWSEEHWDERGFWYQSRQNSIGVTEYDYRYPEVAQTSEQQQTIPRSPGQNIITNPESYDSPAGSPSGPAYSTASTAGKSGSPSYATVSLANYPQVEASVYITTPYSSSATQHVTNNESSSQIRPSSSDSNASTVRWTTSATSSRDLSDLRLPYTSPTSASASTYQSLATGLTSLSLSQGSNAPRSAYNTHHTPHISCGSQGEPPAGDILDPRFKVVSRNNESKFWKNGRVFLALWTEPARQGLSGAPGAPSTNSQYSDGYLGGKSFTEIRRFVVVGEAWGSSLCSPIHTYGGQATLKPNLPESQQHAIIYTTPQPPDEFYYQAHDGSIVTENLSKDPIKVNKTESIGTDGDLNARSRLNYAKVYTLEHYVPVRNIGMVDGNSMKTLLESSLLKPRNAPEKPRKSLPKADSKEEGKRSGGKGRDSRDKQKRSTRG